MGKVNDTTDDRIDSIKDFSLVHVSMHKQQNYTQKLCILVDKSQKKLTSLSEIPAELEMLTSFVSR